MTAPEAPEWLRETIEKHQAVGWFQCECGAYASDGLDHYAHLATVIWEATRTRLADAWEEGVAAHSDDYTHTLGNPYRAADTEEA